MKARMLQCPRCLNDQLARVPRTTLERLLYSRLFECRMCGYRSLVRRRPIAATMQLLFSRYSQRQLLD